MEFWCLRWLLFQYRRFDFSWSLEFTFRGNVYRMNWLYHLLICWKDLYSCFVIYLAVVCRCKWPWMLACMWPWMLACMWPWTLTCMWTWILVCWWPWWCVSWIFIRRLRQLTCTWRSVHFTLRSKTCEFW